jgi:hypothetical protein
MIKDFIQTTNKFNYKPQFRINYGELVKNDEIRLSECFIEKMKDKKVQNYFGAILDAIFNYRSL